MTQFQEGNQVNTYWFPWRIRLVLKQMLDQIKSETDPKKQPYHLTLGGLCSEFDIHPQRVSEWEKEYPNDPLVAESIKRIKLIFETRVNEGALLGKLNFVQAIFNLKNNFGWKDEQHITDERMNAQANDIKSIREDIAQRRKDLMKKK